MEPEPAAPPSGSAAPPSTSNPSATGILSSKKKWNQRGGEGEFGGPQNLDGGEKFWLSDDDSDSDEGSGLDSEADDAYARDDVDADMGVGDRQARLNKADAAAAAKGRKGGIGGKSDGGTFDKKTKKLREAMDNATVPTDLAGPSESGGGGGGGGGVTQGVHWGAGAIPGGGGGGGEEEEGRVGTFLISHQAKTPVDDTS
jgi:hypothetical protein